MSVQQRIPPHPAALFTADHQNLESGKKNPTKYTQLESLGSVVVSGCPPLASRICRRVSLNSRPGTEAATVGGAGGGAEVPAMSAGGGAPSRNAFSCAAFCARSRLSASICALIAARAFFSSSFSEKKITIIIVSRLGDPGRRGWDEPRRFAARSFRICLFFRSSLICEASCD